MSDCFHTPAALSAPWVLVAGGFHSRGGMDKANLALACHLAERGAALHLVAHQVEGSLLGAAGVTLHLVQRPLGSFALGEILLDRAGRGVALRVQSAFPASRVVVNGSNCLWGDVNWVHALHHAWPTVDRTAPAWFRAKNAAFKHLARKRERRSLRLARLVIVNSNRTRDDVVRHLGIDPSRVQTIYLGADADSRPCTPVERQAARQWLSFPLDAPVVAFIGALGRDRNKGFDTLWAAWRELAATNGAVCLVVAGAGASDWRMEAARWPWGSRTRFLGFTDRVSDVLAASDLLVSPVRYDAYGLNVHEALCRGVPAIVSRSAGVAERFPAALQDMILPEPDAVPGLLAVLRRWLAQMPTWRERVRPFAASLRAYTWRDMAERFVAAVHDADVGAVRV